MMRKWKENAGGIGVAAGFVSVLLVVSAFFVKTGAAYSIGVTGAVIFLFLCVPSVYFYYKRHDFASYVPAESPPLDEKANYADVFSCEQPSEYVVQCNIDKDRCYYAIWKTNMKIERPLSELYFDLGITNNGKIIAEICQACEEKRSITDGQVKYMVNYMKLQDTIDAVEKKVEVLKEEVVACQRKADKDRRKIWGESQSLDKELTKFLSDRIGTIDKKYRDIRSEMTNKGISTSSTKYQKTFQEQRNESRKVYDQRDARKRDTIQKEGHKYRELTDKVGKKFEEFMKKTKELRNEVRSIITNNAEHLHLLSNTQPLRTNLKKYDDDPMHSSSSDSKNGETTALLEQSLSIKPC